MTEPFVGEIQVFGFNFVPPGWAQCNGALLRIQQHSALFALIGTTYGGDGQTTFALPNLTGRGACNQGQAPGLSHRVAGETFGAPSVTLTSNEMAAHQHGLTAYTQADTSKRTSGPSSGSALSNPTASAPFAETGPAVGFAPDLISPSGGGQPHENRQPYLAVSFCIALEGAFPSFD